MLYSNFHGLKIAKMGFGCMRFQMDPQSGEINQDLVNRMFDLAIANGVNYFDTAYPYLGGKSEIAVAKGLAKYPRESYYLADKFPGHSLPGPIDNRALFEVSLKKCNTTYFDFYLLHNVTEWSIQIYEDPNYHILEDMLILKKEGKIRHLGFSFHGGNALLERLLNQYDKVFDFVQIQCNYLDWTLQNAKEKYDMITSHGLGVWIMEPLHGGKLTTLPQEAVERLNAIAPDETQASFALRFLMRLPNVQVILSGMTEYEQVVDNLATYQNNREFTKKEEETLLDIAESLKSGVPCTRCRYCCDGCPQGLDIPYLIECYNTNKISANITSTMRIDGLPEGKKPSDCLNCGACVHACPQGIHVNEVLHELAEMYEKDPKWSEIAKPRVESIRRDLNL